MNIYFFKYHYCSYLRNYVQLALMGFGSLLILLLILFTGFRAKSDNFKHLIAVNNVIVGRSDDLPTIFA